MPPDLARAEEAARTLLLRQKPPKLPILAERLSFGCAITIGSMEQFCRITSTTLEELSHRTDCLRDGCTLVLPGQRYVVLYNATSRSLRRRNFTVAHELGHIFLGHKEDGDSEEQEANCFAAELIVPRILAAKLLERLPVGMEPAHLLTEVFFASAAVARIRLRTMWEYHPYSAQEKALLCLYGAHLPSMENNPIVTY